MSLIKKAVVALCIVALAGGVYYVVRRGPCERPITYRIGAFDPKFGVSRADFLADAAEAEQIWEAAAGKQLFAYDPQGDMPINLVYDTRQATVDTNKVLAADVAGTESSATAIQAEILSARARYAGAESQYKATLARFQTALSAYNAEIESWNARGGAPRSEYDRLQEQKAALEDLRSEAESQMVAANDLAREANTLIDRYNSLVKTANATVSQINRSADREFEQGDYAEDAQGRRIDVYEFDGEQKLVRLLAHEFGHALGLEHNSDPQSIMYYLNKGTSLKLSAEDQSDLRKACALK